jgi:hypothetical protein
MTLQEAIQALFTPDHGWLDPADSWIRPVSWRGMGSAWCLSTDRKDLLYVPTPKGGVSVMTTRVAELLGEWEVIPSSVVLRELDERGGDE